jgi:hypothetical protein
MLNFKKNIMKKLISFLFIAFMISSCNDDTLDPFLPGVAYEEQATRTAADLNRILNSAQNFMTNRTEYTFTSIFTDEAAPGSNNGGQGVSGTDAYYLFFLVPTSTAPDAIWQSNYNAMARINLVLKNADKVATNFPSDANLVKRIVAEAKILRALAHLKVLAYYSTDMTNDAAPAGIIADRTFLYTEKPSRATIGATYAFIHRDLDDAIALYTNNTLPAQANPLIFPTINLARALKARAYAYKKDYVNAGIWANNVITNSGITLATRTQLPTVFHSHTSTAGQEVIYKFRRTNAQNSQGSNLHNGWVSVSNSRAGSPFYEVSRSLFNVLNNAAGTDARRDLIVRPAGGADGSLIDPAYSTSTNVRATDIIVPFKHGGSGASTSSNAFNPDFIQMRISEMYFIRAESRVAAGDLAGAAADLKMITDRRFVTAPALLNLTTAQQAWKAILDERRVELAFEGHRFIDLKRLYQVAGVTNFDRDAADYAATGLSIPAGNPANFAFSANYKWALPIPQSETNANASFTQNPGY